MWLLWVVRIGTRLRGIVVLPSIHPVIDWCQCVPWCRDLPDSPGRFDTSSVNLCVPRHYPVHPLPPSTTPVPVQVLGNAKGVVAAAVSVAVFKNIVTAQGALGYAVTVGGVFLYSTAKRRSKAAGTSNAPAEPSAIGTITSGLKDVVRQLSVRRMDTNTIYIDKSSGGGAKEGPMLSGGTDKEETQPFLGTAIATPTTTRKPHPAFRPGDAV